MITYKQSGVDIETGDICSKAAYSLAKKTFKNRENYFGKASDLPGGFSGLIDMGDFYLAFNCDGVGSKIEVAEVMNKYDTLGFDLVAMVADDAVSIGAEPISLVNTIDIEKTDKKIIEELMKGLVKAAEKTDIIVSGGEIAEMPSKVKGALWSASLIGAVKKEKLLGKHKVRQGNKIVGLLTDNLRSNGFSLARKIMSQYFGAGWHNKMFSGEKTWGDALLAPSDIFSPFILKLIGRFNEKPKINVNAIAHITGGGIYNNVKRVIPENLKADFDNLPEVPEIFKKLIELGNVSQDEAYRVWNMGIGMAIITDDADDVINTARKNNIPAQVIGEIINSKLENY